MAARSRCAALVPVGALAMVALNLGASAPAADDVAPITWDSVAVTVSPQPFQSTATVHFAGVAGDAAVTEVKVVPTCHCLTTTLSRTEIPAHAPISVDSEIDLLAITETSTRAIQVEGKVDGNPVRMALRVTIALQPVVSLSPTDLRWGTQDALTAKTVRIHPLLSGLRLSVESNTPGWRGELQAAPNGDWSLVVTPPAQPISSAGANTAAAFALRVAGPDGQKQVIVWAVIRDQP